MNCEKCGASVTVEPLYRQNPKGEPGRFRCARCSNAPVDPTVANIVDVIHAASPRGES